MSKLFVIGWKDLRLMFRDRAALLLMLATPFALTLGVGLVSGAFSSGGSGIPQLPLVVVNQDDGQLGAALEEMLTSPDLADLLAPTLSADPAAAREQVMADKVVAAVIIPAGFTDSIIPRDAAAVSAPAVPIEVYTNPGRPISAGIVRSIVEGFVDQVEASRVGGQVAIEQLLRSGLIAPQNIAQVAQQIGQEQSQLAGEALIRVRRSDVAPEETNEFNPLLLLAPGMALVFLMFTVSLGSRSILVERRDGTLARMMSTATGSGSILVGKITGVYLVGAAQMFILILASALLFRLRWGDPLGVIALVLAAVAGAAGWGLLLAAVAKTPNQVATLGMALMLLFGVLGGNFFGSTLTGALGTLGKITPNAWAMDGFTTLARGGDLADIAPDIAALLLMGAVLLAISVALFNRKGFLQR
ncbi:MAG TPA: ABC transporter permease [Anaerolineae bacterium]|nr:ABC transporter permease [Anaerolineae bacterium]HNU03615.1 ABC transporter permease [Anaerolineae bacterium]